MLLKVGLQILTLFTQKQPKLSFWRQEMIGQSYTTSNYLLYPFLLCFPILFLFFFLFLFSSHRSPLTIPITDSK
ncbi:uncharacterized protein BDW43DRAFT_281656 [Aspergillus alliaceus]|uniref:uncharacterized protein n=1 Tax=Petromyces alliaceus TaxID=209559 RepID=UPI0012A718D5|nr:uncharacterized protein BDW43DRAFT_281656 [Aspergillus alliaceus]KAB8231797.1 hypothetical protein BDW43DRAFT_281656 [Aspergillus alliaceus]